MVDGRYFQKSRLIAISQQPFSRFWRNLARWRKLATYREQTVKISNFSKTKMAAVPQQRIDRSSRNLVWLCKMGLLTVQTVKKFKFPNSKMVDGPHLKKTVQSPYLCSRLTDMDVIWHDDANWPPTEDWPLKFPIFKKPRWRRPPSWKTTKITISSQ